jgi:hypothetical protein
MIPLPVVGAWKVVWRYRKIAGIVILGLALALISWRVAAWRSGYLKHGEAVKALSIERDGRLNDRKTYLANSIKAEKEAQALAADLGEIRTRFANMATVLPKTLIRTIEVPRETPVTSCPEPRVSPEFVSMWNDAGKP